jgi:hypothetical protein
LWLLHTKKFASIANNTAVQEVKICYEHSINTYCHASVTIGKIHCWALSNMPKTHWLERTLFNFPLVIPFDIVLLVPRQLMNIIILCMLIGREGCRYVFQDTHQTRSECFLAKTENNWPKIKKGSDQWERKSPSPGWRVGLHFLLTKPKFHLHLTSWRV